MSQPWTVLAAIVAIAVGYVLVPVFIGTFRRFRAPNRFLCPVTGEDGFHLPVGSDTPWPTERGILVPFPPSPSWRDAV